MELQNELRPYLINAFYIWCIDYHFTPLIKVVYDKNNSIPENYKSHFFNLFNIHPKSIKNLVFGKKHIEFQAQFEGEAFKILINYESIVRIYYKEGASCLDFETSKNNFEEFSVTNLPHLKPSESHLKLNKKNHLKLVKK